MKYAVNSLNGKKVMASDSLINRHINFVCPICQAPVLLRKGKKISSYFAHKSKQAKSSCELYMSAESDGSQYRGLMEREAPYRTLGLYLRLSDGYSPNTKPSWSLELNIPEADIDTGKIRIPFSSDGLRVIPTSSIKSGGIRVRILPRIGVYNIIDEDIPAGRWKNRVSQPIPGLSSDKLNVFCYSPFAGRRLNEEKPFYWGRSYVLIWTTNTEPKWWPSELSSIENLKGYEAWGGTYIQLPKIRNELVRNWVMEHTGRIIEHPPAEIELIAPLPEQRLPDGSYVIQGGKKVILGINGEVGTKRWHEVSIYGSKTGITQKIQVKGKVPSVIQIQLEDGRNTIFLDDIEASLQIIVDNKTQDLMDIPGIRLFARDNRNEETYTAFLHNEEAEKLIKKATTGALSFTGADIPSYVNARLKWRDDKQAAIFTIEKKNPDKARNFEEKLVELLNKQTKQKQGYLSIDAGSFGSFEIQPISNTEDNAMKELDMGKNWRGRATFLLNLSLAIQRGHVVNIYRKIDITKFCRQDQYFLKRILFKKYWPVEIAPQCQALLNESQRMYNLHHYNQEGEQNGN